MGHFFREKRSPNHYSDHFPFKGPAQNLQFFAPNLIGKQKPTPPWCPGPTNNNAQFLEHVIGHKVHATLFMNFRQSWEEKNRFNKLTTPNDLWILYHTYLLNLIPTFFSGGKIIVRYFLRNQKKPGIGQKKTGFFFILPFHWFIHKLKIKHIVPWTFFKHLNTLKVSGSGQW